MRRVVAAVMVLALLVAACAESRTSTETTTTTAPSAPLPPYLKHVELAHASAFPVGPKDWLGGWGYIESVNEAALVFDLIQVNLNEPGDESGGWSFVNTDPTLRHLPVNSAVEIRACPPAPGEQTPGICGSPWVAGQESSNFSLWTLAELAEFVEAGDDLWLVLVDPANGEVVWVEQWWNP